MNVLKCGAGAVVTLLTKYGHRGRWSTDRGTVCVCLCVWSDTAKVESLERKMKLCCYTGDVP